MNHIPDLISLLSLDGRLSDSPFGGLHRTILITKDFKNTSDFAFNSLLHHFSRRESKTPILLVTLSHDWTNYSASAAKCGFNLRLKEKQGNIEVLDVDQEIYNVFKNGKTTDLDVCDYILTNCVEFIENNTSDSSKESICKDPENENKDDKAITMNLRSVIIMFDDLTILNSLQHDSGKIFRMIYMIDQKIRKLHLKMCPNTLNESSLSYLIVQSTLLSDKQDSASIYHMGVPEDQAQFIANMENFSDLVISLKPLETGYSTRVDGTIKIVDNRIPRGLTSSSANDKRHGSALSLFPVMNRQEIGQKLAYFYKLGDRRVRLMSSAMLF